MRYMGDVIDLVVHLHRDLKIGYARNIIRTTTFQFFY